MYFNRRTIITFESLKFLPLNTIMIPASIAKHRCTNVHYIVYLKSRYLVNCLSKLSGNINAINAEES